MEEEKKEVTESTQPGEGDKPESNDPVERAVAAAERLEKENEKLKTNIKELRELKARDILGGKSETGETKPKEQTPAEYAKEVMSGKHG